MADSALVGLASILAIGIGAQWLSWRFHIPSIVLLLLCGFVAGPITGFLDPDQLLGEILVPFVQLAVGVILFEGGLDLRVAELKRVGKVIRNLVTVGLLITWVLSAAAAYTLLDLSFALSVLLGSILTVTGPTVIIPLLRQIRLTGPGGAAGMALKWEGIVIDPIGAVLAVLVFEAILVGALGDAAVIAFSGVLKTVLVGGTIGLLGALVLIVGIKYYWVPDFLQSPVALSLVVGFFALSNVLQHEAGLLTVTVMGIVVANQKQVRIRELVHFKENLRTLLISSLFILLAARVDLDELTQLEPWRILGFIGILIFVARPLAVLASTYKSDLSFKERLFICSVAPRGIVAASVASVFSIELVSRNYPDGGQILPITFLVIVGTVVVYGLFAPVVARILKLSQPHPQGILIIGGHRWAREIALALNKAGCKTMLVDTNRRNISAARALGLPAQYSTIFFDHSADDLVLEGIGRLIALTSNDEVNTLAGLHFTDIFGRKEVYQLHQNQTESASGEDGLKKLRSRILFGEGLDFETLESRFDHGARVELLDISESETIETLQQTHGSDFIPLFVVRKNGDVSIGTLEAALRPTAESKLICIIGGSIGAGA